MITSNILSFKNALDVKVEFGKNDKGSVFVSSWDTSLEGDYNKIGNILTLRDLGDEEVKIGDTPKEPVPELPKVELIFHDEKSIDVIIEHLKRIKNNLHYPDGVLGFAC